MGIAGNKDDLYENKEVDEEEGRKLANEYNAIFQLTSAKDSYGIDDLFTKIGEKFFEQKSVKIKDTNNSKMKFKSLYKYINY